jgi:uncharacterized protein YkwD
MISKYTAEAIKEAIQEMSVKKPVAELKWDDGIFKACRDHIADLGPKGKADHKGSDGKTVTERLNRYGKFGGIVGENYVVSQTKAKEIILSLIIDFGNSKKAHRRALMDAKFVKGAVCSGFHATHGTWTVLDYSGQ